MKYVDTNGVEIESFDLSKGKLVDFEWIDHPEVKQEGHFKYKTLGGGGLLQNYIIDIPYQPAWREVVTQQYIPYTDDELVLMAKSDYSARLDALEAANKEQRGTNTLLSAQIQAVSDRGEFVEDCIAEMAEVIYA